MLEQRIRTVSEALARGINRRTFLRHTGTTVVSGVSALVMGSLLTNSPVNAEGKKGPLIPAITCSPPGPYCNTGAGNLSGCHGAHCYQHLYNGQILSCQVYYAFYAAGCWTTGDGWTCCDCSCGSPQQTACGCAQQHSAPFVAAE